MSVRSRDGRMKDRQREDLDKLRVRPIRKLVTRELQEEESEEQVRAALQAGSGSDYLEEISEEM